MDQRLNRLIPLETSFPFSFGPISRHEDSKALSIGTFIAVILLTRMFFINAASMTMDACFHVQGITPGILHENR